MCGDVILWKYLLESNNFAGPHSLSWWYTSGYLRPKTASPLCTPPVYSPAFKRTMQQSTFLALDFPCDQLLKPKLMSNYNLKHALFCAVDLDNACESFAESTKYRSWEQVLKATIKVESNHLWIVVDKHWYLSSGSVGIPVWLCSRFPWSIPFLPPSDAFCSMLFGKYRGKSFVRDRQTHKDTQGQGQT